MAKTKRSVHKPKPEVQLPDLPDSTNWKKRSNAELKQACESRGLTTQGSRNRLIQLLFLHCAAKGHRPAILWVQGKNQAAITTSETKWKRAKNQNRPDRPPRPSEKTVDHTSPTDYHIITVGPPNSPPPPDFPVLPMQRMEQDQLPRADQPCANSAAEAVQDTIMQTANIVLDGTRLFIVASAEMTTLPIPTSTFTFFSPRDKSITTVIKNHMYVSCTCMPNQLLQWPRCPHIDYMESYAVRGRQALESQRGALSAHPSTRFQIRTFADSTCPMCCRPCAENDGQTSSEAEDTPGARADSTLHCTACGHHAHRQCFHVWAEYLAVYASRLTCPVCLQPWRQRGDWGEPGLRKDVLQRKAEREWHLRDLAWEQEAEKARLLDGW